LLANILLDDLDRELERRGHRFVRYADDLLTLLKSPKQCGRGNGHNPFTSTRSALTVPSGKRERLSFAFWCCADYC